MLQLSSRESMLRVLNGGTRMRRFLVASLVVVALFIGAAGHTTTALAISYPAGWNLISGPAGSTVAGASGPIFSVQPGDAVYESFPASSPLRGGWGYWAFFPNGGNLTPGTSQSRCLIVPVPGAWVMVGNPSTAGAAPVSGADDVLTYTPMAGSQQASSIPVGAGAWVIGSGTVGITVPAPAAAPVLAPPIFAPTQPPFTSPPATSPPPASARCRVGTSGCACGNSCITCRDTCHQSGGCARR